MRLPNCVKVGQKYTENRPFKIINGCFEDMIVTWKNSYTVDLSEIIAYDRDIHWAGFKNNVYTTQSYNQVINWMNTTYSGYNFAMTSSNEFAPEKYPFKCPVCSSTHDTRKLIIKKTYITCWSALTHRKADKIMIPKDIHLVPENN